MFGHFIFGIDSYKCNYFSRQEICPFLGTAKCPSASVLAFCIPISNVRSLLHKALSQSMLSSFWNFASLIGKKSYPRKVLVCIYSSMNNIEHLLKLLRSIGVAFKVSGLV